MNAPQLNDDCFYFIVKFLQNNHSNLFNCLLVNRFWCKITVPLLYAKPFSKLNDKAKILIITTFFLCLNEEERKYLKDQDVIYKISNFFQSKPIFEYPKYIKHLPKSMFCNAIEHWYKKQIYTYENGLSSIWVALFHMFLRQSNCIKDLEICSNLFEHDIFDIHFINTFIFNLSNLTTLRLNYYNIVKDKNFSEFLQIFAKYCKNLLQLSFEQYNSCYDFNKVASIIKQQNGLKEFIFHGKQSQNNIFSSLEFQKNSLVSLRLYNITFQKFILQSIITLHNLKLFEIDSFYEMTLELCKIFEFASFKLKTLIIKNRFCDNNITSQIIKYLGINLQILKLKYINIEIMETIIQYSLDLKTLDINYSNENLSILSYLKHLKIKNLNIHSIFVDDKLFFAKLAESLSEITTNISFTTLKVVNKNCLLNFLNNCHNYVISLNFNGKFELEHFKVILNYIKKNGNNLKYLGISNLNKIQDTKKLDLLDQISRKGIKLVKFSDNYYKKSVYFFLD